MGSCRSGGTGRQGGESRPRCRIQAAAERPGFFGDLRRAIIASHLSVGELSAATGVDQRLLSDFRAGDAELPAAALERLVDTLHLRLMQEIPHRRNRISAVQRSTVLRRSKAILV